MNKNIVVSDRNRKLKKGIAKDEKHIQKEKNLGIIVLLKKSILSNDRIFYISGDLVINLDFIIEKSSQNIRFDEVSKFRPFITTVFDKKSNSVKFFRDSTTPESQVEKIYYILDSLGDQYAHRVCLELKNYMEIMKNQHQMYQSQQRSIKPNSEYSFQKSLQIADQYIKDNVNAKFYGYTVRTSKGSFFQNQCIGMSSNQFSVLGYKSDEFQHLVLTQGFPLFFSFSLYATEKLISDIKSKTIFYEQNQNQFMDIFTHFRTSDNQMIDVHLVGKRIILQEKPNSLPDDMIIVEGEYDYDSLIKYFLTRNPNQAVKEIEHYKQKVNELCEKFYKNKEDDEQESNVDHIRCKFRPINEQELMKLTQSIPNEIVEECIKNQNQQEDYMINLERLKTYQINDSNQEQYNGQDSQLTYEQMNQYHQYQTFYEKYQSGIRNSEQITNSMNIEYDNPYTQFSLTPLLNQTNQNEQNVQNDYPKNYKKYDIQQYIFNQNDNEIDVHLNNCYQQFQEGNYTNEQSMQVLSEEIFDQTNVDKNQQTFDELFSCENQLERDQFSSLFNLPQI